jgi:hypothetical protein
MVADVSRFWKMYLLGCKCFELVTEHAIFVHLLKHLSDKLKDRHPHWAEKIIPYAVLMRILCIKGILNDADPMSRRPDFPHR